MRPEESHRQAMEQITWHSFPLGDVFLRLNSKRGGLSSEDAKIRLKHFGENILKPEKPLPGWRVFLKHFLNPLNFILIFAVVSTMFLGSYADASIIIAIILFNSLLGFIEEHNAEKSLNSLKKLEARSALALRDGNVKKIEVADVVPGDVIFLRPGTKVPADARLIKSYGLQVNESILTGESSDIFKGVDSVKPGASIFERSNIVFSGTVVVDGSADAVVFGTGESSEIGRVGRLVKNILRPSTIFERRISKLSRFIGAMAVILSGLIFLWGWFISINPSEMLLTAVAIAVAAVPEGLAVAVIVILVIGARRILKANGLIRSLAAAETLGSVSVILTDKTGTLTRGKMQVSKILTPERRGGIFRMNATVEYASNHMLLLSYGMLASDVIIENIKDEIHKWVIHARPVDKALVTAGARAGLDLVKLEKKFKKVSEIHFNSNRKFSASFRENPEGEIWAFIVGAADVLLPRIKKVQILNRFENAIPSELSEVKETVGEMAKNGGRILAVCSKKIETQSFVGTKNNYLESLLFDLNFIGLVSLKDPVREDAKEFLAISRRAGLRTVMITGDHSLTAEAVAKEAGFLVKNRSLGEVMEGKELDNFEPKELAHRIRGIDIFSRVTPEHKLKIAEAWQSQNEVVAVVGDGVNDAPALRRANIGVALASGVDLAKESSDMILLDDSFISLIKAIQEGRVITANLKKVTAYLLSTSFSEIILVALSLFFGLPLPIVAVQILWVNLAHEILPVMALALDPAEKNVMDLPPESAGRPILDGFLSFLIFVVSIVNAIIVFGIFYFFYEQFENIGYARSVTFAALGVSALFYAFSMRSLRTPIWAVRFWENKYLVWAFGAGLVLIAVAIYAPPLQVILHTQAIGAMEWLVFFGSGVLGVIVIEIGKWLFVRRANLIKK